MAQLEAKQKKLRRRAETEFDRLFAETPDAFAERLSAYLRRPMEKPTDPAEGVATDFSVARALHRRQFIATNERDLPASAPGPVSGR